MAVKWLRLKEERKQLREERKVKFKFPRGIQKPVRILYYYKNKNFFKKVSEYVGFSAFIFELFT